MFTCLVLSGSVIKPVDKLNTTKKKKKKGLSSTLNSFFQNNFKAGYNALHVCSVIL